MDLGTIIGLIAGIGALLTGYLLEKGALGALVQISAIIIILGGTAGALLASFPLEQIKKIGTLLKIAFTKEERDLTEIVTYFEKLAQKVRSEGLLSLEEYLSGDDNKNLNPLIKKGIQLVVDGTDPDLISDILQTDIASMAARHKEGASLFTAAGGYSPTMGVIGTVMGLIQTLANMGGGAEELVKSISTAFIATLYGVGLANLVYLPLGSRLKIKSEHEMLENKLIVEGILSIQSGENPRIIVEKLKSFIPRDQAAKLDESQSSRDEE